MSASHHVSRSQTFPVAFDGAFTRTIAAPLPELFTRGYGPIPSITSVDQEGPWTKVGEVRTVHTSDGATTTERLLTYDEPNSCTYELSDLTGPLRLLVSRVEGAWTFESVGTGCRITWSWTLYPRSSASAPVLPIFGRLWQGYARLALDSLEEILLAD